MARSPYFLQRKKDELPLDQKEEHGGNDSMPSLRADVLLFDLVAAAILGISATGGSGSNFNE